MNNDNTEIVLNIITKVLDESGIKIDSVGIEEKLDDLGINSLSFIKIVVAIEEQFKIEFDDEDLTKIKFKFVKDIINYVNLKLQ